MPPLQWKDVSLERNEIIVSAVKAKVRRAKIVPISSRLRGVRLLPTGAAQRLQQRSFG